VKINLLCLTDQQIKIPWQLGDIFFASANASSIEAVIEKNISQSMADAWLLWDSSLGSPPTDRTLTLLLNSNGDVWHAGLRLGLQGHPDWINYVSPVWMLNCDPNPERLSSSWRLSLRACLIRTSVLEQLGGVDPEYHNLTVAGLALGLRYIRLGAFVRYAPNLLDQQSVTTPISLSVDDQCHFIHTHYGSVWLVWTAIRAFLDRSASISELLSALKKTKNSSKRKKVLPYKHAPHTPQLPSSPKVSIVIPTVNRYPYLRALLSQIQTQTIAPHEIIIVDQTPENVRDENIKKDFSDLPIQLFTLKQAGQCSSRNIALQKATGDFILFLDDDDSIPEDLIEKHLLSLSEFEADVSNGIAHEKKAGEIPDDFRFVRVSDVFPTNNTMIRKGLLQESGLFDLAYDQGQRADHDLGMRLYTNGAFMVLNPAVWVIHHHAPIGGLREHKARKNTYAASRRQLFKFNLPTISDIYLAKRYYTPEQVREMFWISVFAIFSIRGPWWKRLLRIIVGIFCLPWVIWLMVQRNKKAAQMLQSYPQINPLTPLKSSWNA
jgi:glycosyltransferase involved in cell wall biosynthesis